MGSGPVEIGVTVEGIQKDLEGYGVDQRECRDTGSVGVNSSLRRSGGPTLVDKRTDDKFKKL